MIKGIAHLCIRVTDLERTARFYCEGLGLEKAFDFIRDGEVVGFYLRVGSGSFLEFFRREPVESGPNPLDHLALETDSIDAVNARLAAAGYPVGEKKTGADHAWQAWLTDPDGVRIELHEYTADSCQKTGENCLLSAGLPVCRCKKNRGTFEKGPRFFVPSVPNAQRFENWNRRRAPG